jgi:hypothetical protein
MSSRTALALAKLRCILPIRGIRSVTIMHSQPLDTYSSPSLADEPLDAPPFPQRRHTGPFWQVWKGWLWLTGPRPQRMGTSIAGQERLRRSRLVSILLVVVAVAILLLIPGAVAQPLLWQAVLIDALFGLAAALLNRSGRVTLSGLVLIALIDLSTINFIITQAHSNPADPGLSNTGAAAFYLLILPALNAGMVLPNRLIPVIGGLQVVLTVVVFAQLPPNHLLQAEMQASNGGQTYNAILGPILLEVCGVAIVWLYSWSVDHAIVRASRAEELAEARARLNVQAQQITEQKRRLEEAIHMVQTVQSRVANGDYSARVSLQENDLLPLAVSFNILAERLGRAKNIEQDYHRLEGAVQHLVEVCAALVRGTAPAAMRATGTVADRLSPYLARLQQLTGYMAQIKTMAEDLHTVLQRQGELLAQVESRLVNSLALAKDLSAAALQTSPRPADERTGGPMGMPGGISRRTTGAPGASANGPLGASEHSELRPATAARLHALLDQQIALLEQAKLCCEQASDLGNRCTRGSRLLSQRLKETG